MKVKINEDAFSGLTHYNGQVVSEELDKQTKQPIIGVNGLKAFSLSSGGRVYLDDNQYTEA